MCATFQTAHDLTQLAKKNGITVKRSTFQADPKNAIESLKVRYIASYNKVDTSKQIIFVPKFVSNLYSIYANAAKKNGITVKRSTSQADPKNAIESLKVRYIASYNKVDTSKQIIFVPKFVSNLYSSIYANAAIQVGIAAFGWVLSRFFCNILGFALGIRFLKN